jgi:micrococcal nuclease
MSLFTPPLGPVRPPAVRRLVGWLLVVLSVAGCGARRPPAAWQPSTAVEHQLFSRSPRVPANALSATVVRVVDGDTLLARLSGQPTVRVRVIGVDTPETVKPGTPVACFGAVASDYAKHLLTGLTVRAAYEPGGQTDRYGRDLWDVWLPDGRLLAGLLVADGLGRAYPYEPQVRFAGPLASLQAEARAAGRGLWGSPCHGRSFSTPDRAWHPP